MIFRYVHVPRPDGTLRRAPYIPLKITNKFGKPMDVVALLDSGADTTVVPKDLAEVLGLKLEDLETETGGIGGKVRVKKSRLSFRISGGHESHSLSVPALVLQDENADVPLLLGRHGFFEQFEITFRQDAEKIILKKISPKKEY